jgi:glutaredoxin 2
VTPGYVRQLLSNAARLRGVNWPEPLVQAYAVNIKLKRQVKLWQNQKTSTN